MFKPGDVVFFKEAHRGPSKRTDGLRAKHYAFGVLLGNLPPFAPEPPAEHLMRLMGGAGFMAFDDVLEVLGEEAGDLVIRAWQRKYWGAEWDYRKQAEPSALVDATGQPVPKGPAPLTGNRMLPTAPPPEQPA
jgi:hypothetical protein